MTIISPHGRGHGPMRPVGRGEEIFGNIVVGLMVTAVGAFLALVACGLIAFAAASAVHTAMSATGLLSAWIGQVAVAAGEPLTGTAVGDAILRNVLFGALVGLLVGVVQFVRRWREARHRWLVEAVISPSGLAALSYGAAGIALHVLISGLAAWAAGALFGVFLQSPAAIMGGDGAGLVLQGFSGGGGDGGAGGDLGEVLLRLLFLLAFVVLIAAVAACNLFAAAAWVLFRLAPWTTLGRAAGEGAISGVAHGAGALAAAIVLQLAISRLGLGKDGWRSREHVRLDFENAGTSFFHAFVTAALSGAAQSAIYAAAVLALSAAFGIVMVGG